MYNLESFGAQLPLTVTNVFYQIASSELQTRKQMTLRSLFRICPGKTHTFSLLVLCTFEMRLFVSTKCVCVCVCFRCEQTGCHGLLRPAVVWFGETLDADILTRAEQVLDSCDLCLVVLTHFISILFNNCITVWYFAPNYLKNTVQLYNYRAQHNQTVWHL